MPYCLRLCLCSALSLAAMEQLHWGHQHLHLSQVLSVSIYGPDIPELVYMTTYTDRLEGKFSYIMLTDVNVG